MGQSTSVCYVLGTVQGAGVHLKGLLGREDLHICTSHYNLHPSFLVLLPGAKEIVILVLPAALGWPPEPSKVIIPNSFSPSGSAGNSRRAKKCIDQLPDEFGPCR